MPLATSELLQPIVGANPGGKDLRYEPIYDQIKRARTEEDDLPTGEWSRARKTADHALVVKLATEALSKRSKDLQIAAWLTEALLKREGFAGLRSGIELVASLLMEFWANLYPAVEDGDLELRAAPLEWVGQYLGPAVRLLPIDASGHTIYDYRDSRALGYEQDADTSEKQEARKEAIAAGRLTAEAFDEAFAATPKAWYKQLLADVDAALASLDALDMVGQDRFRADAPGYGPLRDAIGEVRHVAGQLLAKKLETDPDPIEVESLVTQVDTVGAVGGRTNAAATVSVVPQNRADAEARIAAAARFLRAESPTNPAPYLLLRGFRWGELRVQPDGVDPKLLAAPPTELRSRLRGFLLDGRWTQLLDAGEDMMATPYGRGWLDLQRYVLAACAGLGSEYDQVAATIRAALQSLLRDLPQLRSLMLMDDTPTANQETQGWLSELALAPDAPAPMPQPRKPSTDRDATRGAYERALDKARAGEPEKAIELLIRLANQEKSARERFLRRAEAAGIMVEVGREAVAMPILQDLVVEIEQHALEEWEAGETIALPLGLLYRCLQRLQGDAATMESLYLRICRLDPIQAIQIAGQPAS